MRFCCIYRYVNRTMHPVLSCKIVFWPRSFYLEHGKPLLCSAFSVFIGRSHSISGHKPRSPSESSTCVTFMRARWCFLPRLVLFVSVGVHISEGNVCQCAPCSPMYGNQALLLGITLPPSFRSNRM